MSDAAIRLLTLGQQLMQQTQDSGEGGGPTVCFVLIAPFLAGAAVVAVRSFRRLARTRAGGVSGS